MAVLRYLVPALAVAGHAAAASCSASTTTIGSAADASALASCQTFTGSVAIATGVGSILNLDGVQEITGDVTAMNMQTLNQLSGDSLSTIGGTFTLNGLTALSTLNFPHLSSVDSILWEALPVLQSVMTTLADVAQLVISNTGLTSLNGITLQSAENIDINNNPYLNMISMPLVNITTALNVASNAKMLQLILPNLATAANMTISDASVISIPALHNMNGSLGFYSNQIQSISAPNLTSIDGTLAIDTMPALTNVSFPLLKNLNGGLQIQNNTMLSSITGFPVLAQIGGAISVLGSFNQLSLPALQSVIGGADIDSTEEITSICSHFMSLTGSGNPIHGTVSCSSSDSNAINATTTNGGSGPSTTGGTSSGTSSSAAHPLLISGATGLLGVVAAIFGML